MKKQLTVAFSIAILLTFAVVGSIDVLQTADATKASGTPTQKYGSATKSIVCGDKLCSEVEQSESKDRYGEDKAKHGESSHESKEKMKQKHLQMLEKMKSMNKDQMIDSMKSMIAEHHEMKIEKMNQMDESKLLKHIEKMLDKMNKDDHFDMDDTHHEDE
ncbi:MAG: hypothetical protein HKP31_08180, partial [Nitrosopumilus sp.]|nr:hypothetical protein [Nitrosopumilus sp.]